MNTTTTIRLPARRRWLSVLLAFLIFIAGLVAGVAVTVGFTVGTLQYLVHHPENAPARITNFLARRLSLDASQREHVLAIVTRHHVQIENLRRQIRPQVDQQLDQVRAEVSAVLSVDQRVKWEELFDRLRDRWMPTLAPAAATSPSNQP